MYRYLVFFLFSVLSLSQTTGKVSGVIVEKDSKEPLPGANIYLVNTAYGTASDASGRFTIINIPPGKYAMKVDM
ncbi:MAG: carboxypeptidase-like regulatory domain-containing protein, partial [Candidatus Neomarinimicrobiota bacterium]